MYNERNIKIYKKCLEKAEFITLDGRRLVLNVFEQDGIYEGEYS